MILGKHALADIYDIYSDAIDDIEKIKALLTEACAEANLNIVEFKFHKFEPYGLSGICILKESHLAIHTWPEYSFASVDAFTCGNKMNPKEACEIIARKLNSDNADIRLFDRGNISE